jgi:hypothetical protein
MELLTLTDEPTAGSVGLGSGWRVELRRADRDEPEWRS